MSPMLCLTVLNFMHNSFRDEIYPHESLDFYTALGLPAEAGFVQEPTQRNELRSRFLAHPVSEQPALSWAYYTVVYFYTPNREVLTYRRYDVL